MDLISVGEVVALGMCDGSCPAGVVEAMDNRFIRLRMLSVLTGDFGHRVAAFLRSDINRIEFALPLTKEEAKDEGDILMSDHDPEDTKYFDTKPLMKFQSRWIDAHAVEMSDDDPDKP